MQRFIIVVCGVLACLCFAWGAQIVLGRDMGANGNASFERPAEECQEVLARLRAGAVGDDEVIRCLKESRSGWGAQAEGSAAGVRFFGEVIPLLQKMTFARGVALAERGDRLKDSGNVLGAIEAYKAATAALEEVDRQIDETLVHCLVERADGLAVLGKKEEAEGQYVLAMQYPWYFMDESGSQQSLRDLYVRAGVGLIEVRRGNLAKLQRTVFVPAADEALGPRLRDAIREAAGDAN